MQHTLKCRVGVNLTAIGKELIKKVGFEAVGNWWVSGTKLSMLF